MNESIDNLVRPEIQVAATEAERERIYRFRYAVYVEEMGKRPSYADHAGKRLYDPLDDEATLLYAAAGEEIVATVRINLAGETGFDAYWNRIYQLEHWAEFPAKSLSMTSRLMVAPDWRGSTVLAALLAAIFRFARENGVRFDFCNCTPSLVEFYEQLGYRRYADGFMDKDAGYHVPLVFMAEDIEHMRAVRSPFWREARKLPADATGTAWFIAEFPAHAVHINKRLVDTDGFWALMEDRLHVDPREGIGLLKGLDEVQARAFLDSGTVLPCKAGEIIIRPGDIGNEMFVVLDGVAEVWGRDADGKRHSLAVVGPGQVFGEIAFVAKTPRTAQVVANTDMELLILTQSFIKRALKKMPEIVAPVLLNLSVILCERLRGTTQNWLDTLQQLEETENE
ncbi:MAG: GNAT family N-acetyltransferase [Gammaproteobacteria bacterium]|nr:GNAT family N-acetyltransferase [Gammaproteobacteria bacterium]MCP5138187.1 GNAT family N-acetyltransferase [Gammaproteobacteria bacterium]